MSATVIILPVVRGRMRRRHKPVPLHKTRRYCVALTLTPEEWARMERMAREADANVPAVIAGIVQDYLWAEADESPAS